mgnify:CR=1 FL=1
MKRSESYKRIKENKNDDFEDRLLKRELYKSMKMKDNKNTFIYGKTFKGKLIQYTFLVLFTLLLWYLLK